MTTEEAIKRIREHIRETDSYGRFKTKGERNQYHFETWVNFYFEEALTKGGYYERTMETL